MITTDAVNTGARPASNRPAMPVLAVALAASSIGMIIFRLLVAAGSGALSEVFGPSVLLVVAMAIVGGLVASRRPYHTMGWVLLCDCGQFR